MLPKYRYDEVNAQLKAAKEQNDRLQAALRSLTGGEPGAPEDPDAARKARVLQQLTEVVPGLTDALELAKDRPRLTEALARLDLMERSQKETWDGYATESLSAVHERLATLLLGADKHASDLSDAHRRDLTNMFVNWVGDDPARMARYDAKDATLREDFVKSFLSQWADPLRRQSVAPVAARARKVANLPTGGTTSSPMGTRLTTPKAEDEDDEAIYRRAWTEGILPSRQG